MRHLFLIATVLVLTTSAHAQTPYTGHGAQPMEEGNEKALKETQDLLRNRSEREKAIAAEKDGGKAAAADSNVKSLLGEKTDTAYDLSAGIMETLVRESNGDTEKLKALVLQLQSNPQMLEKYLTTSQREQIRGLATDVQKKQGSAPVGGGR